MWMNTTRKSNVQIFNSCPHGKRRPLCTAPAPAPRPPRCLIYTRFGRPHFWAVLRRVGVSGPPDPLGALACVAGVRVLANGACALAPRVASSDLFLWRPGGPNSRDAGRFRAIFLCRAVEIDRLNHCERAADCGAPAFGRIWRRNGPRASGGVRRSRRRRQPDESDRYHLHPNLLMLVLWIEGGLSFLHTPASLPPNAYRRGRFRV